MKSFMAQNEAHSIPEESKTIQSNQKLKGALQKMGAYAYARNMNVQWVHVRTMRDC